MTHPNLFEIVEVKKAIARINNLTSETRPEWGKMNSDASPLLCAL
jgi:ribosomal protein L29